MKLKVKLVTNDIVDFNTESDKVDVCIIYINNFNFSMKRENNYYAQIKEIYINEKRLVAKRDCDKLYQF